MNRAEWCAHIESKPLTSPQRGRIMRECDRLGLADRAERLAVLAALVGLDALGSTANLTQGQGGYLTHLLQRTRDRTELPEVTVAAAAVDDADRLEVQDHDDADAEPNGERISLLDAIERFLLMLTIAVYGRDRGSDEGSQPRFPPTRSTGGHLKWQTIARGGSSLPLPSAGSRRRHRPSSSRTSRRPRLTRLTTAHPK